MTKSLADQLAAARSELAEAEVHVKTIADREDAAAVEAQSYAAWRSLKAEADIEVARLQRLIGNLTTDIDAEAKAKAATMQAALEAEADRAAADAAAIIQDGLRTMHSISATIMAAIASSNAKIEAANRNRAPGSSPLETAEYRARRGQALERVVIAEREFEAWSYANDRRPISEETAAKIIKRSGNRGTYRSESGAHDVVLRQFRETRFLPEVAAQFIEPLAETLAIPPLRAGSAPGWTPQRHATDMDIRRQCDEIAAWNDEAERRRPQVEVECLGDVGADVAA